MRPFLQLVIVLCAFVFSEGSAVAYDDHDYCLDNQTSERTDCRAEYLREIADCQSFYAFDQWVPNPDPLGEFLNCKADALLDKAYCIANVTDCSNW